jgi:hypothetical protein
MRSLLNLMAVVCLADEGEDMFQQAGIAAEEIF